MFSHLNKNIYFLSYTCSSSSCFSSLPFPSLFFWATAHTYKNMPIITLPAPSCPLPYRCSTDAGAAVGSDLPFSCPLIPPSKSNQVLLWGITTLLLFSPPVPMADMAVSVSTPIFYSEINQKKLFLFPLLIGLQKQPLDFDKKWLRLAARDFCRSGNLAPFLFVRERKNSSRSEALTRTG